MKITGLHLLLTYKCTLECDHCFVWGSPNQSATLTRRNFRIILDQIKELGTVETVYFEGGEPFLYYPVLLESVREAHNQGFQVGIVTNGYWATDLEDALVWLRPFVGTVQDLSISSDLYHWNEKLSQQARVACQAAEKLEIPVGLISVAQPEDVSKQSAVGHLPPGESAVMYRGRAASKLVPRATLKPWGQFTGCPFEDLRDPGRIHLDPLGYIHICQGISLGNVFQTSLREVCATYQPETHPITGPLLRGGPVELTRHYGLPHAQVYADACHFCYSTRLALREQFPEILAPDAMYGMPCN